MIRGTRRRGKYSIRESIKLNEDKMNKRGFLNIRIALSIALVLLLNISTTIAQRNADRFRDDLDVLKTDLPEKHINLFAKISKAEFEQRIEQIKMKADNLSEETFLNELLQLMVAIGDEHTSVFPPDFFSHALPISFTIFEEGIFVTSCTQPDLLLSELIAIDGTEIKTAIEGFKKIIPHENNSFFKTSLLYYVNNKYIIDGMDMNKSGDDVVYKLKKSDGTIDEIALNIGSDVDMQRAEQFSKIVSYPKRGNYNYSYDEVNSVLYFNYQNCKEDKNFPFEVFNDEMFQSIKANKPNKLVIDLRYNGGGNSAILKPFLTKLKDNYLNEKGRFYVLIGRMTFSSALLNAIELKQSYNAILVGEPTAGNVNHYGEIRSFTLPNTGMVVNYSTKYFKRLPNYEGAFIPDVIIRYSVENFKDCKDEALEYIYGQ